MKTELCAAGEPAVRIAKQLGINRVELCQQLEIGGITPSMGLQQFSAGLIETHVLVRPRGGGFVYSSDEKEVMLSDILFSGKTGVHGVVVGALNPDGGLDLDWLKEAVKVSGRMELTCHRVFDEVKDWKESMEMLVSLGFKRILSSGQASDVLLGKAVLKLMKVHAAGRIEVMAGGGVRVENVKEVIQVAVPDAVHFSGTKLQRLGGASRYAIDALVPDAGVIEGVMKEIERRG